MAKHRKKPLKAGKSTARNVPPFPLEFRLKVARLYIEDGYPAKLIATQFGTSEYSVYYWGKNYHQQGEQGLADRPKNQP